MLRKLLPFIPFLLWIALIIVLLTLPAKDFSEVKVAIPFLDKIVHFGLFALLVVLYGLPFIKQPFRKNSKKIFLIMLFAIVLGITMEFVQKYCTNSRGFSEWDMVADAIGAVSGFIFVRILSQYFNDQQSFRSQKNA